MSGNANARFASTLLIIALAGTCTLGACKQDPVTGSHQDPSAAGPTNCGQPGGPACLAPNNCDGAWTQGPLPDPWWTASPPGQCAGSLTHSPTEAYDDCTIASGGYSPSSCGLPLTGAVVCLGNAYSRSGRTSVTCQKSTDCPKEMVCVAGGAPDDVTPGSYGYCEKSCTNSGDPAECIRCDLACNSVGVCAPKRPDPGPACTSDCQCGGGTCTSGFCRSGVARPLTGFCGPPGSGADCACAGGTCRESDRCCILPDGTAARGGSPACNPPPDAGATP